MGLTKNQVNNRCLVHAGNRQCRYLEFDRNTRTWNCCKLLTRKKKLIDRKVAKLKQEIKKGRVTYDALGDGGSCQGYLYLPHTTQGYDVNP